MEMGRTMLRSDFHFREFRRHSFDSIDYTVPYPAPSVHIRAPCSRMIYGTAGTETSCLLYWLATDLRMTSILK